MRGPAQRLVRHLAESGDVAERDWAGAALAEAAALPAPRRTAWLRGAAWFLLRRRRPTVVQAVSALAGCGYGLLLVLVPVADLRDDAPDVPFGTDVAVLVAGTALVATFVVAAVRPLLGALAATLTMPAYLLLVLAGRQAAFSRPPAEPPAGYGPLQASPGLVEPLVTLLVLAALVALPALALAGAVLPLGRRPRGEASPGAPGGSATEGGVRAPSS